VLIGMIGLRCVLIGSTGGSLSRAACNEQKKTASDLAVSDSVATRARYRLVPAVRRGK
jgi:hypothetical protein